jgi:putative membrane protein
MSAFKQIAVALALGLAGAAIAQAPAPRPAPQAPQQQAAGQSPLTQQQQVWIGAVWYFNQMEAGLGAAGATRASAKEVKDFARKLGDDHKRLTPQLAAALQQRGVNPASLPQSADLKQLEEQSRQIQTRSGADFDQAFVSFIKEHGSRFVDALKSAREATPGSDASLKKLLDQFEDVEEGTLTAARQLEAKRVQARTPPGR